MKKVTRVLLFLTFLGLILFAAWKLLSIRLEYFVSEKNYQDLASQYAAAAPADTAAQSSGEHLSAGETTETEPKEYAPISVDFDELRQEGGEIVGWIYCEDTVINYPVTHHADNDYYLHRLSNGEYNAGGSIFLECQNQPDFSDWNNILYGHHMADQSMFGSLTQYRKQEYADEHPILYLLTPEQDYKICVIGGYTTISTSDSYVIPYDEVGREELVQKAVENTEFVPQFTAEPGQKLITLSTCSYEYDEARFILVGTLVPLSRRTVGGAAYGS